MSTQLRNWLNSLRQGWQRRQARRADAAQQWLKARYHIFRILLADNERALHGMAELDRLLQEQEPSRLQAAAEELGETVLEMVDALNRLTDSAHPGLYPRLHTIRRSLETALERHRSSPQRCWIPLDLAMPSLGEQVGGKASPLALLQRAGLPVPAGVVIVRRACREYLRAAHLEDRLKALLRQAEAVRTDVEANGEDVLAALATKAQAMIRASTPTPAFAGQLQELWDHLACGGQAAISVRSSASHEDGKDHSFAGQYASVLGLRQPEALLDAFKTVLASAFSARAMAYRMAAGLGHEPLDMAVLCQRMIAPHAAGVLFTLDPLTPETGRMLLTAVPGLGELAVAGRAPADIYRPARDPDREPVERTPADIAVKSERLIMDGLGGTRLEMFPADARPLLGPDALATLRDHALRIEALLGGPQDIEWAIDEAGAVWILQARPARLAGGGSAAVPCATETPLLQQGVSASPGKGVGRLVTVRSAEELHTAAARPGPVVLALHHSLVDAAPLVSKAAAVLVDLGNPLDHLACVARERGIPMLTGLGTATSLTEGKWVLVDAVQGAVFPATAALWEALPPPARQDAVAESADTAAAAAVRNLALALHLTDAYGPTFSVLECRSLHDLVRFIHEKAVLALFQAGDAITEDVFRLVHRLQDDVGLLFFIIDLGGGLAPNAGKETRLADLHSEPLAALCRGMATPGLRWRTPPPVLGVSGLMGRSLLDARSERPVGNPNYALISRDYLNLNARVDYHFVMIDAVCGANARENAIRFRFKGGGTTAVQRARRARCVERVLREEEFFTTRQEDMVTAQFAEGPREMIREKLVMLGRFLGFSRLLDAVMVDDAMPDRVAEAFRRGDYSLELLAAELAVSAQA